MAKQGQHKDDARDTRGTSGRNNPKQSMTITTGTPKKKETYEQQAREHKDTDPLPQASKSEFTKDARHHQEGRHDTFGRSERDGSDSNASNSTRGH